MIKYVERLLYEYDIEEYLVKGVRTLYHGCIPYMRWGRGVSKYVKVKRGHSVFCLIK